MVAERLITVSAMTAFCLLRQRNLESEPNERGQCAAEAERHCDHGRFHDPLGDFAPPSQMSAWRLRASAVGRHFCYDAVGSLRVTAPRAPVASAFGTSLLVPRLVCDVAHMMAQPVGL